MEKKTKKILIFLFITLVFLLQFSIIYMGVERKVVKEVVVDTVTVEDTIYIKKDLCVKTPSLRKEISDGITTRKIYSDTLKSEQDTIIYSAVISDNRLDSIRFNVTYPKITDSIYITKTITKTQSKKGKLLTVNPSIGAGYGVINKRPDIYVGVSLSFNIFR